MFERLKTVTLGKWARHLANRAKQARRHPGAPGKQLQWLNLWTWQCPRSAISRRWWDQEADTQRFRRRPRPIALHLPIFAAIDQSRSLLDA